MKRSAFIDNKPLEKPVPEEDLWRAIKLNIFDVLDYGYSKHYQEQDLYVSTDLRDLFMLKYSGDVAVQMVRELRPIVVVKSRQPETTEATMNRLEATTTYSYKFYGMPLIFLRSLNKFDGFITFSNNRTPLEFTINTKK